MVNEIMRDVNHSQYGKVLHLYWELHPARARGDTRARRGLYYLSSAPVASTADPRLREIPFPALAEIAFHCISQVPQVALSGTRTASCSPESKRRRRRPPARPGCPP
eukprot:904445-Prymnesium_polylepis.1